MTSNQSILRGPTVLYEGDTVHELLEKVVQKNKNEVAIIFEENGKERRLTYSEFDSKANSLAKLIHQTVTKYDLRKVNDNDYIIGLSMLPSDSMIIAMLAIWKAGAAYVPIEPSYPHDRINHILSDAKPAMIICDNGLADEGKFPGIHTITLEEFPNGKVDEELDVYCEPNDLAVVLFTSGSTGTPKGVCVSHKSLLNRLLWQIKNYPFTETEKVSAFKTVFVFMDSVYELWTTFLHGLSILVIPKPIIQNPEMFVTVLEMYKIERLILVPSLLSTLIKYKEMTGKLSMLKDLRLWISSGEALSSALAKEFYTQFARNKFILSNSYGSTEVMDVTTHSITHPDELVKNENFPLGTPISNTIIYVLDQNLHVVKQGDIGEICTSGPMVSRRNLNNRSQEKLINNPFEQNLMYEKLYKTGDMGKIQNGLLFYCGRNDSLIKIHGQRVDLLEIESVVNSVSGVSKGIVLCQHAGQIDQVMLAFIKPNKGIIKKSIEADLKTKLPNYMMPKIVLIDTIPFLVNGKIDRQTLLRNYESAKSGKNEIDYKGVPKEKMIAAKLLFETVNSLTDGSYNSIISLDANFFDIGGNSLNAVFTINKLKDKGYHIAICDFAAAQTLEEILNKINLNLVSSIKTDSKYVREPFHDRYKQDVIDIITSSFLDRSNLEFWIDDIVENDFKIIIGQNWSDFVSQKLSFVIKEIETGKIVGVSLNYDYVNKVDMRINRPIDQQEVFLDFLEEPFRDELLEKYEKIFAAYSLGTAVHLTPQENVAVMEFGEANILEVAKCNGYNGVITANHSPITQQLGETLGYQSLCVYQMNQYVTKEHLKLFGNAHDSQTITLAFKSFE